MYGPGPISSAQAGRPIWLSPPSHLSQEIYKSWTRPAVRRTFSRKTNGLGTWWSGGRERRRSSSFCDDLPFRKTPPINHEIGSWDHGERGPRVRSVQADKSGGFSIDVRSSPFYPRSNGKIERWHKSLKTECIRPKTPISLADARRIVTRFVDEYNRDRWWDGKTGYSVAVQPVPTPAHCCSASFRQLKPTPGSRMILRFLPEKLVHAETTDDYCALLLTNISADSKH